MARRRDVKGRKPAPRSPYKALIALGVVAALGLLYGWNVVFLAPQGRQRSAVEKKVASARLRGRCDYLLLPSGGRSSLAPELLARAEPGQLIASTATGRLARDLPSTTLRTDQEGAIVLPL